MEAYRSIWGNECSSSPSVCHEALAIGSHWHSARSNLRCCGVELVTIRVHPQLAAEIAKQMRARLIYYHKSLPSNNFPNGLHLPIIDKVEVGVVQEAWWNISISIETSADE
uniref:Uncharacterized protein n=1 Tax=Oryza sativa subsp. japonica TaxID=39947 RepID=Q6Z6U5_ORYSJ|nr:hypothetical protein [Oryza sativa Japonica Group]